MVFVVNLFFFKRIYTNFKKYNTMLNFAKSEKDLEKRSTVQHRVICDWLRNIDKKLTRIESQIRALERGLHTILENENHAESMAKEYDSVGSGSI